MDGFIARGHDIYGEGAALAAKGDYKAAIMAMQAATDRLQKALRIAGVQ